MDGVYTSRGRIRIMVSVVISSTTRVPEASFSLSTLLRQPTTYLGPLLALTITKNIQVNALLRWSIFNQTTKSWLRRTIIIEFRKGKQQCINKSYAYLSRWILWMWKTKKNISILNSKYKNIILLSKFCMEATKHSQTKLALRISVVNSRLFTFHYATIL